MFRVWQQNYDFVVLITRTYATNYELWHILTELKAMRFLCTCPVVDDVKSLACYSLPQKKGYTFCRSEYSKLREARWKVGGAPHTPLSWSKLGQASFQNVKMRLGQV